MRRCLMAVAALLLAASAAGTGEPRRPGRILVRNRTDYPMAVTAQKGVPRFDGSFDFEIVAVAPVPAHGRAWVEDPEGERNLFPRGVPWSVSGWDVGGNPHFLKDRWEGATRSRRTWRVTVRPDDLYFD